MNQYQQASDYQGPNPDAYPGDDPAQMEAMGYVWKPWAMGGGEWIRPPVVTLSNADVERIARRVVELLKG